ncbi:hypothetical protein BDV06DRAFT_232245 [Aspergillus oleicola]
MSTSTPAQHRAAIVSEKAGPMTTTTRQTPTPGPEELLIKVQAIALNPVDHYQRDHGFPPIPQYPTVLGSDIAGTVVSVGPDVPSGTPKPGARIAALASGFYQGSKEDYGAFQDFEEGAILPLAVFTAWNGWYGAGFDVQTNLTEKEAVLVWGGSSSIGSLAVQTAKSMGFVVYTTASAKHHGYLNELGADWVFDYRDEKVVSQIIDAVKKNGFKMRLAYGAVPDSLTPILDVLKEVKGDEAAKIAYAPVLPDDAPTVEGIEAKFAFPPTEPDALRKRFAQIFGDWLSNRLAAGEVVPSPHVQVVEGGLDGLNKALDVLKGGVSGAKVVVSL